MKYNGILFFDYDGTLSDEKEGIHYPTEKTKEALTLLQKNNYLIILATGRSMCYIPDTGINFDGYVTSNGSYAQIHDQTVYESYIDKNYILALCDRLDSMNLAYSLENQTHCYAKDITHQGFSSMLDNFNIPKNIFDKFDKNNIPNTSKLLLYYEDEEIFNSLSDTFKDYFVFDRHRKFPTCDIAQKNIQKSVGAKAIVDFLGIDKNNVYAFGDGTNDYDMLKFASHGIAMGYHAKELEDVCESVTDTVKNEGIYKALKKYSLI